METHWRIEMLGHLLARHGDRTVMHFRSRRTGLLLAYLAYYPSSHSRDLLTERIWPEQDTQAARNSLRVALASLRHELEASVMGARLILASHNSVSLNPDLIETDVADFRSALAVRRVDNGAKSRLEEAVALYRGPLLPDLDADWIVSERCRMEDAYLGALRDLVRMCARAREIDRAIDFARRAIATDPLQESLHRLLIQLLIVAGRPAAALEQYRELETRLSDDLGIAPSAAARELVARLRGSGHRSHADSSTGPRASAPWASQVEDSIPRLPETFTSFFGREAEMSRLLELLRPTTERAAGTSTRLLTVTGPGGCGKTRLALEAARRLHEVYRGKIWFIPLADLTDASQVAAAICRGMALNVSPSESWLETIADALRNRTGLLILDNLEHLLNDEHSRPRVEGEWPSGDTATLIGELRCRVPLATLLITSRRRLNLSGEHELSLAPLPLPEPFEPIAALGANPCIRLFVDRARAIQPGFELTDRNAGDLRAVCRCLDGLPLAIELGAAWAHTLTPRQMRERLSRRLDLLVHVGPGHEARHSSLRTAIEWSYRLLPPAVQRFFARLSIFRGGWTLDAAESIFEEPGALEYTRMLRERSLITAQDVDGEMRFRMLETLRQFADQILPDKDRGFLRARHAIYYSRLTEQAAEHRREADCGEWIERIEGENENVCAALDWLARDPAGALDCLRMTNAAALCWRFRGHVAEARQRLYAALSRSGAQEPTVERAMALNIAGVLAALQSDRTQALEHYHDCLDIFRELGDKRNIGGLLNNLANFTRDGGDYAAAIPLYRECIAIAQELDYRGLAATALMNLAENTRLDGDQVTSRNLFEDALASFREIEDTEGIATALCMMAAVCDDDEALLLYRESLKMFRSIGEKEGIAFSMSHLADVLRDRDHTAAHSHYCESLVLTQELGDRRQSGRIMTGLARLELRGDSPARSAFLLGAAARMRESARGSRRPDDDLAFEAAIRAARNSLSPDDFAREWERGCSSSWDSVLEDLGLGRIS